MKKIFLGIILIGLILLIGLYVYYRIYVIPVQERQLDAIDKISQLGYEKQIIQSIEIDTDRKLTISRDGIISLDLGVRSVPLVLEPGVSHSEGTELLSIILDPEFEKNNYVYILASYIAEDGTEKMRYVCYTLVDNQLRNRIVLFDNITIFADNPAGSLETRDDNMMYLSFNISDTNSVLWRLKPNGKIPSDNPIKGSAIFEDNIPYLNKI